MTQVFAYCQPNTRGGPHFYWSVDAEDRTREPAEVWQRFSALVDDFPSDQDPNLPFSELARAAERAAILRAHHNDKIAGWERNKAPRWYAWSQT